MVLNLPIYSNNNNNSYKRDVESLKHDGDSSSEEKRFDGRTAVVVQRFPGR